MRIAVATEDKVHVSGHIKNCNGFLIFNVEKGEILTEEFRQNNYVHKNLDKVETDSIGFRNDSKINKGYGDIVGELGDSNYLIALGTEWNSTDKFKMLGIKTIVTSELNAKSAALILEQGMIRRNN